MKFNKEKFLQKYNDMRGQATGLSSFEKVYLTDKVGISHNHNTLTVDFLSTEFFKNSIYGLKFTNRDWNESKVEWKKLLKDLNSYEAYISTLSPNDITFEVLFPYFPILTKHFTIPGYPNPHIFRWYVSNALMSDLPEKIEYTFLILNQLKNTPIPERDKIYSGKQKWNYILSGIWGLVNLGLWEEALFCVNTLEQLLLDLRLNMDSPSHILYPQVKNNPTRFFMSLNMVKGKVFLATNQNEKALRSYKDIVNLRIGNDIKPNLTGYPSLTRVFEAAIEVYKLEPTEKNKQQVLWLLTNSITSYPQQDATEAVRERCLIVFMLAKVLFPKNIK